MKHQFWTGLLVLLIITSCGKVNEPSTEGNNPKPSAQAEVGNGGHGVVYNGRVYLYDLVEAGIESNPTILNDIEAKSFEAFSIRLARRLEISGNKNLIPFKELGAKLRQLETLDPIFAMTLYETICMHQWKLVPKGLKVLPLQGDILDLKEGDVVLVANRRGRTVYINEVAFEKMDRANAAALMIHEGLNALIAPIQVENAPGEKFMAQDPVRVREIVGALFSTDKLWNSQYLKNLISSEEFPRTADGEGIGGAFIYKTIRHDDNAHFIWTEGMPYFMTTEGEGMYFIHSDPYRDEHREFCEYIVKNNKQLSIVISNYDGVVQPTNIKEVNKRPRKDKKPLSGIELTFSNFQNKNEIKTYVKFAKRKDLPEILEEHLAGENYQTVEECVDYIKVVGFDLKIRMNGSNSFSKPIILPHYDLARTLDRSKTPVGWGIDLKKLSR